MWDSKPTIPTLSVHIENPRHYRKAEQKLKRLHRAVSRKQKKSANRKKSRKRYRTYLKVQRQREDFAAKRKPSSHLTI